MIRPLIAAFLLACAAPAAGQPLPSDADIAARRDSALNDELAWDITEGLTTEVGPRLAGTPAEARARDWAVARLRALGFVNVRVESFEVPLWTRGAESAEILAPFPQPLAVTALGNSASTPPQGISGEVVGFDSLAELEAAPDAMVRGRIVFVSHAMPRTQDGSGYGAFGGARRTGPSIASRKGALAILIRSIGTDHHRNPHTGVMNFLPGAAAIPAGALAIPDAEQLQRVLKRGQPVQVRLTLVSASGRGESGNVIAEVPGRDPKAPPVLVGCHLDSWDLGTGSLDDAAGCGIVTAAAKRIMEKGRPLRPIRIVWFGAEEIGLFGGLDYQKRYGALPHYALAESDFGAGRVWKVDSNLGPERADEAKRLQAVLAPLGIVPGALVEAGGSDIGPMLRENKQPGVALNQDGTHYFDVHHSAADTLDKVDPEALRQNVAAWTAMLAVLSGGIAAERKAAKRR